MSEKPPTERRSPRPRHHREASGVISPNAREVVSDNSTIPSYRYQAITPAHGPEMAGAPLSGREPWILPRIDNLPGVAYHGRTPQRVRTRQPNPSSLGITRIPTGATAENLSKPLATLRGVAAWGMA
jgi:hypothetical protein